MQLVMLTLLVFLPLIPDNGRVFSQVQTVTHSREQISTADHNTVPANTNSSIPDTQYSAPKKLPQSLYAAWMQSQNQEAASDSAYRLEVTGTGDIQGHNPVQRMELSFQSGGVTINGMSLSLTGIGYQGQTLERLATVAGIATDNKVEYQRANGLTEWYYNNASGLEQGFTLSQVWPRQSGNELALELSLTGGLFQRAGNELRLVSDNGSVNRYGGLYVYDATGRALSSRMEVSGDGQPTARILVNVEGAQYPLVIDPLVQPQTLTSSDGAASDYFGNAVALSGDGQTALIGAYYKNGIGTNGIPQSLQGAAYLFVLSPIDGSWSQQAILTDTLTSSGYDHFGSAVSLSNDGNTALIGAENKNVRNPATTGNTQQGAAYIFTRSGTNWSQQQILTGTDSISNDFFGNAVSLSGDGQTALIGADQKMIGANSYQGSAYIFTRNGNTWSQQSVLTDTLTGATNDNFGSAVSLSNDGNTALIAARNKDITGTNGVKSAQGAAYVFTRNGTSWSQQQQMTSSDGVAHDGFGRSVALSSDGSTILIGAAVTSGSNIQQGAAYIFTKTNSTWSQQQILTSSNSTSYDFFGDAVALSSDGKIALIGTPGKNAAFLFARLNTSWLQQGATLGAASGSFGYAVTLSGDGLTAIAGANYTTVGTNANQGAAYTYGFLTSTTTLAVSPSLTSTLGQPVTLTATLSPITATGTVEFYDSGFKINSSTITNGVATFSTSTLSVGTHSITAVYSGNTTFAGSTSAALTQIVSNGGSGSLVYYPLPKPIRVLDTRAGQAALYNGSNGYPKFTVGQTVTYTLAGISYGGYNIPAAAQVVVASLSAVNPTGQGYLTLYPGPADLSGANRPLISSLNYRNAAVTSNTSYLTVGTDGTVNVYSVQATDLVLDISGYYAPAGTADPNSFSTGLLYYPLPKPIRVLDTRAGQAALYSGGGTFTAGQTKNYALAGISYGSYSIPAAAKALVANTTAVSPAANGFLTIYPGPADTSGANRPAISSMNYRSADVTTSGSYPTLDASGVANIYSVQATDVIMDVSGYFAPAGTTDPNSSSITGLYYTPLAKPIRVLDTRAGQAALYSDGRFTAGATKSYTLTNITYGGYTIPAEAKAVVANTTAVIPAANGFLTIYPGPADTSGANRPTVSSLNYRAAFATTSNPSHVTVSSLGVANIYSVQATDVIMDVSGYYVP
jgi:hypothetical protein